MREGLAFAGLEQALPPFPHTVGVDAVGIRVDEVNGDPQVWLSEEVVFVLFFQRSRFVLDEPGWGNVPITVS